MISLATATTQEGKPMSAKTSRCGDYLDRCTCVANRDDRLSNEGVSA